jgi:hypothetical protein
MKWISDNLEIISRYGIFAANLLVSIYLSIQWGFTLGVLLLLFNIFAIIFYFELSKKVKADSKILAKSNTKKQINYAFNLVSDKIFRKITIIAAFFVMPLQVILLIFWTSWDIGMWSCLLIYFIVFVSYFSMSYFNWKLLKTIVALEVNKRKMKRQKK